MAIYGIGGVIRPDQLGKTYMHEHLYLDLSRVKGDPDTHYDATDLVIEEMKQLKAKGISTIVEVTNHGMGRDLERMQRIVKESGIQVVISTGFYKDPFLPASVRSQPVDKLVKMMIRELNEGIGDSGIRAQLIGEIGTSKDQMTEMEAKVFEAAARAHRETGAAISTHTTLGTYALEQLEFFKGFGVDLEKVVIGHVDLRCDMETHLRIAQTGATLAFDTIGKINYASDEARVKHIKGLIERGHVGQIVLSQDLTRKSHLKKFGGIGYCYMLDEFLPKLREAGVEEEQIMQMLVKNPVRVLDRKE
jgi:phosphotriesterase-related protein